MAKADRPVWRTTLRCGAVAATAGLLIAILLYLLNPLIGFPAWCLLIWPSAIMLMALSGMSDESAQLWWLAIVASNALFYFLVTVFVTPLIILLRRRPCGIAASKLRLQKMIGQPAGLLHVLMDESAEYGDRHDAAMGLGGYNLQDVEEALGHVASQADADEDLAESCGESLAEIWSRKGRISEGIFLKLTPASRRIALATLRNISPDLVADAENILEERDKGE